MQKSYYAVCIKKFGLRVLDKYLSLSTHLLRCVSTNEFTYTLSAAYALPENKCGDWGQKMDGRKMQNTKTRRSQNLPKHELRLYVTLDLF
jgi:hypothetical protein